MNAAFTCIRTLPFFKNTKWSLFALLFFCFAAAILGDSTAEALLLAKCDAHLIPTMFLVNAAFLFLLSAFLMSLIDRVDRGIFFLVLTFGHGTILLIMRICVAFHLQGIYLPLFSYAYVSKIVLFLLFWTLANDLVDSRKASKEFPFIAAGGTLGAILVSFSIPWLLHEISAENLLIVWAALSYTLGIIFLPFKKMYGASFRPSSERSAYSVRSPKRIIKDIKLVRTEPLLRNMAVFYFFLFFVLLNQHFIFYSQLKRYLFDARSLASFLGYFNGFSMFATLFLQIGVAGVIIKKIGSTRSMLFLPAVLCVVFLAQTVISVMSGGNPHPETVLAQWLFWSVVAGMGLRVAFFDSFFSPNFQVFFSSLPHDVRGRGKLLLEGVVKPAAIAFASVWMIAVFPRIPLFAAILVMLCASIGLLVQTFRLRGKYAQSLTVYLAGFRSKKLPEMFNLPNIADNDNYIALLETILHKEEFEIKKFIIDILCGIHSADSVDVLVSYIDKCDTRTCATIISALGKLKREDLKPLFSRYLQDADRRVVANSILALAGYSDAETQEGLSAFLNHPDCRVKTNTIVAMWNHTVTENRKKQLSALLVGMIQNGSVDECASALFAIGETGSMDFVQVMKTFMVHKKEYIATNPQIRRQLLFAIAKLPCDESLDVILSFAVENHLHIKTELHQAVGLLIDKGYPVSGCMQHIRDCDYVCRNVVLETLCEKHVVVDREFDALLDDVADRETAAIYSDWLSLCALNAKTTMPEVELLCTAIHETSIHKKILNLICIAALYDRTGQIGSIMHRLYHPNRHIRARAFEVLDNAGNAKVNRCLLKLLDSDDTVKHGREATISFKQRAKSLMEAVSEYVDSSDSWLRTTAVYATHALYKSTEDQRWENLYLKGASTIALSAVPGFSKVA